MQENEILSALDGWADNNINVHPSQRDKPGFRSAARLVAGQVLSGANLHDIDADLLALGWVTGLRGRYWLLYIGHDGDNAYMQAQIGYWKATHNLPEGWKFVPVEPTDEMLEASPYGWKYDEIADVYRAMIAAAPKRN